MMRNVIFTSIKVCSVECFVRMSVTFQTNFFGPEILNMKLCDVQLISNSSPLIGNSTLIGIKKDLTPSDV